MKLDGDKFIESLIKGYDLTKGDIEEVLETIKTVDLEMLLMNHYPIFRNKPWALKLFHYKLKLRMEEADDFDYFD